MQMHVHTGNESFRIKCMHCQSHWWVRSWYPILRLCCPAAWPRHIYTYTYTLLPIRFASSQSRPPADVLQDIMNASAAHENGVITVGFSRESVTNDPNDIPLDQCVYFLYAWGGMFDIMAQQIDYHGFNNREASSTMICLPSSSDCPSEWTHIYSMQCHS